MITTTWANELIPGDGGGAWGAELELDDPQPGRKSNESTGKHSSERLTDYPDLKWRHAAAVARGKVLTIRQGASLKGIQPVWSRTVAICGRAAMSGGT